MVYKELDVIWLNEMILDSIWLFWELDDFYCVGGILKEKGIVLIIVILLIVIYI